MQTGENDDHDGGDLTRGPASNFLPVVKYRLDFSDPKPTRWE